MDAERFIKERERLCKMYVGCHGCHAKANDKCKFNIILGDEAAKQVELLEEWAAAHPRKTRQSVFIQQYPEVPLNYGIISIKPCQMVQNYTYGDCNITDCPQCRKEYWLQEVE